MHLVNGEKSVRDALGTVVCIALGFSAQSEMQMFNGDG